MEKISHLGPGKSNGSLLYQYLATITGTLAVIASGMHFGWPSPSLPQLLSKDSPIPITSSDGSWIAVMPCIGSPPGALMAAFLVDRIGRKPCMLLVTPVYFISWIAIAFSPSLLVLNIARILVGVMDGFTFTVLPMYIGEISDRRIRGLLGCSLSVTFMLGFLLINIVGLYCSIKTTALIASIVPILHFVTFIWMPESPYYYLIKQKNHKAASRLKKLTGTSNVDEEINKLSVLNKFDEKGSGRYLDLFTERSNRKALFIVLGLRLIQQFSGNYTIAFYCLMIFKEAGGSIASSTATIMYFTVQLLGSAVSTFLVDKTGRRPLLLISVVGSGVALTVQGIYFYLKKESTVDMSMLGYLPLIALLLYNVLFNIGLSTIPILVLGEFFPTDVKALALCLVDIFYGGVIVVASKFFQIVNDSYGMYVPFFAFAICCACGLIFIVLVVPETKGKTLEEIQGELKGIHPKSIQPCDIELKSAHVSLLSVALPSKVPY